MSAILVTLSLLFIPIAASAQIPLPGQPSGCYFDIHRQRTVCPERRRDYPERRDYREREYRDRDHYRDYQRNYERIDYMADLRERWEDHNEAMRIAAGRRESQIWTAMPVKVVKDSDGHIVDLQIMIQAVAQDPMTGRTEGAEYPQLQWTPIHFPSGGGLTATHPVKENDEGLTVFVNRNMDQWWRDGGIQPQPEGWARNHQLADSMYIPGFRNKPRQLKPAPSTNSYQIRSDDGRYYIELHQDGTVNIFAKEVNVHSPRINMDGNQRSGDEARNVDEGETAVEVKGTIHATRDISTDQNLRARQEVYARDGGNSVRLSTHIHSGVQGGPSNTAPPVPGT